VKEETAKTWKTFASSLCLVGVIGLLVALARVLLDSRAFTVAFIDRAPLIAYWFTVIAVGTLISVRFTKSTSRVLVILTTLLLDMLLLTTTADSRKLWRVAALMVCVVVATIGALTTRGTRRSRLTLRIAVAVVVPFSLVVCVLTLARSDVPWF
jgi:hypothetical protein